IAAPRRLPLPMKKKVEEEIKRLVKEKIIRPVKTPTDWCAPIVAVPKKDGKVRLCVDFSKLNESVKRENFPLPSTDQLLAELDGATVFTKLDCNSGFHQIVLHEDSQELTTFITPYGRFCYLRLPFGISSGPEIFHREMSHIVSGIPGVICDIDDVLISGRTQKEHDQRVRLVLQKMEAAGVTLNNKCLFSACEIKFLGHFISKDGIKIDPEKVSAIKELARPQNVTELRRLLGMANHMGKFAENLAEITKPLRDLLKKETAWIWDQPQEAAFLTLKEKLSSAPILMHYSANKPTKISADASSYGLGGVLFQKEGDDWKPVFYASRSLTETEQRYAQIEKEALAITWCCEKFAEFLIGLPRFLIETDHKPLLPLLKTKRLDLLTPRIQRFRMRLMRFTYEIVHIAGKNLITADTLSRAPGSVPTKQDYQQETETDLFVQLVLENIAASDSRLEEIRLKQNTDRICSQIMNFCKTDHWPETATRDSDLRPYWFVRQYLTICQGLLLYQSRIVIPADLQNDILDRLHEGHQGIVKCRALARNNVWWPGLSKQIAEKIGECKICEKERKYPPEPLQPTKLPDYPWQKVGMDLFEIKNQKYLIIVDYYSRWIEIAYMQTTTSASIVNHCKSIFARHGIPEVVISDNGPQFIAKEFLEFSHYFGFTHITSSPHFPQGNGEAERAVQTIKNLLKKASDPYIALLNYRSTPLQHGQSPAELLMNRKLRSRIPALTQNNRKLTGDEEFKKADSQLKIKQKENFDKRHRARERAPIMEGQAVWLKTPKTSPAIVVGKQSPRSVVVETESGNVRRNRSHLRNRGIKTNFPHIATPREMSTLPTIPRDIPEYSQNGSTEHLAEPVVQPDIQSNSESP
ncbi:uncharacterized protein K02A2.6-like, partial [Argonauta hians]